MGAVFDVSGNIQDKEYLLKKAEYLKYIFNHVKNVRKGYDILFGSKKYIKFPTGVSNIEWRDSVNALNNIVNKHDESKYTEAEFEPYRRHFYPTELEKQQDEEMQRQAEKEFEEAWEHHYKTNDHHPEYWKYINEDGSRIDEGAKPHEVGAPMTLMAVMHMFCDWFAMDTFQGLSDHAEWYKSDKSKEERACLNPKTKELIKEMFMLLYGEDVSSVE